VIKADEKNKELKSLMLLSVIADQGPKYENVLQMFFVSSSYRYPKSTS